jgi:hypothetical protein
VLSKKFAKNTVTGQPVRPCTVFVTPAALHKRAETALPNEKAAKKPLGMFDFQPKTAGIPRNYCISIQLANS